MKYFISCVLASFVFIACSTDPAPHVLNGEAQGTTFTIKYFGDEIEGDVDSISEIFNEIDRCFSLWKDDSELSKLNNSTNTYALTDPSGFFKEVWMKSKELYRITEGDFNPAIYPIVEAWGFGRGREAIPDPDKIDSLLVFTDFSQWVLRNDTIVKPPSGKTDFNAIAQGYTIDVIASFIERQGIGDYFIEVGGEVKTNGSKPGGKKWSLALEMPNFKGIRQNMDTLYLSDAAIATSGSYRKYFEVDGKKYTHTIDPKFGYPVSHQLLSATVIAKDCAIADALATAFMVKGKQKTMEFIEANNLLNLEVYLIYDVEGDLESYYSDGFKKILMN